MLLVLLAFGVAGMHTLGHPADHPTAGHAIHSVVQAAASGDMPDRMGMNPADVCLAVLTVFGLLVLVSALLRQARRVADSTTALPSAAIPAGRGPPTRTGMGLILADLSVLRN